MYPHVSVNMNISIWICMGMDICGFGYLRIRISENTDICGYGYLRIYGYSVDMDICEPANQPASQGADTDTCGYGYMRIRISADTHICGSTDILWIWIFASQPASQ